MSHELSYDDWCIEKETQMTFSFGKRLRVSQSEAVLKYQKIKDRKRRTTKKRKSKRETKACLACVPIHCLPLVYHALWLLWLLWQTSHWGIKLRERSERERSCHVNLTLEMCVLELVRTTESGITYLESKAFYSRVKRRGWNSFRFLSVPLVSMWVILCYTYTDQVTQRAKLDKSETERRTSAQWTGEVKGKEQKRDIGSSNLSFERNGHKSETLITRCPFHTVTG